MRVVVAGASGGAGSSADLGQPGGGGVGGVAVADLVVTPGRRLYVLVGGIGRTFGSGGDGGFNGGGRGGVGRSGGGGGGGASDLRTCSIADRTCATLASRLIVAAGGGGGGGGGSLLSAISAGAGGSASADGTGGAGAGPGGGAGATSANGGAGGTGAGAGGLGAGGDGAGGAEAGGGGGGGDHGGGGAAGTATGSGSGGGAGSSFGPRGTKFGRSTAAQGLVRITYVTASTVNRPPAVQITGPRSGASVSRRGLVVSGRASDPSGVRAVALRIERLPRTSGRCTWLDPFSGLRRASCDQPPSLSAMLRSSGSWRYRVPGAIVLPGARYRVTAYGTDETGIYGNSARSSTRAVTFRLRR